MASHQVHGVLDTQLHLVVAVVITRQDRHLEETTLLRLVVDYSEWLILKAQAGIYNTIRLL